MQSNERVSTTASEGGRKSSKPVMEKRRRARINASLAELKSLLLEAIRKEGARHNKMEKADILEMAVKHLRQIHRHQVAGGASSSDGSTSSEGSVSTATRYHLGFQACAQEVSRYLGQSNTDEEVELKTRLLNHLANCITSEAFPTIPGVTQQAYQAIVPQTAGVQSAGPLGQVAILSTPFGVSSSSSSLASVSSLPASLLPTAQPVTLPASSQGTVLSTPSSSTSSSTPSITTSSSAAAAASLSQLFASAAAAMVGSGSGVSSAHTRTSILIPIPLSPLSIASVSPASSTTGIPTPEKRAVTHAAKDNQPVSVLHDKDSRVGSGSQDGVHTKVGVRSLDLSCVQISDRIPVQKHAATPTAPVPMEIGDQDNVRILIRPNEVVSSEARGNIQKSPDGQTNMLGIAAPAKAVGTMSILPNQNIPPTDAVSPIANTEINNNSISSTALLSDCNQNQNSLINNLNVVGSAPAVLNVNQTNLTSSDFVQLQQTQLLHLLQQQQQTQSQTNNQTISSNSPTTNNNNNSVQDNLNDKNNNTTVYNTGNIATSTPVTIVANSKTTPSVDLNTCLFSNLNQFRFIPTRTATGEIAFILSSTGGFNPAPATPCTPLASHATSPIRPCRPCTPPGMQSGSMPPPPVPTLRRHTVSLAGTKRSLHQRPQNSPQDSEKAGQSIELPDRKGGPLMFQESLQESKEYPKAAAYISTPVCSLTNALEQEQAAPLNLSAPKPPSFVSATTLNTPISAIPPQIFDIKSQQSVVLTTDKTYSDRHSLPTAGSAANAQSFFADSIAFQTPATVGMSRDFVTNQPHPLNQLGIWESNVPEKELQETSSTAFITPSPTHRNELLITQPAATPHVSRALDFRDQHATLLPSSSVLVSAPNTVHPSHSSAPINSLPGLQVREERGPRRTAESRSNLYLAQDTAVKGRLQELLITSNPPAAHSGSDRSTQVTSGEFRDQREGQPLRHQREKTLFRPW